MRFGQTVQVWDTALAIKRGKGIITQWDVENKIISITPQIPGVAPTDKIVTDGIAAPAQFTCSVWCSIPSFQCIAGTWLGFSQVNYS